MKITNPNGFISLGGRLRYLVSTGEWYRISGEGGILDNIEKLRAALDSLGMIVSRNLLDSEIAKINADIEELANDTKSGQPKLTKVLAERLRGAALNLEKTVFSEAATKKITMPVPRRIDLDHLLANQEKILGTGVFDSLTSIAQADIRQACRCIAFECSTAAAFHILRCVEECVRMLYTAYFPRRPLGTKTWGQLTTELGQKAKKPKPDATLLAHLDHLRNRFRNPTDHPEKLYGIEEAEDLLHIAADAINRCVRDPKLRRRLTSTA